MKRPSAADESNLYKIRNKIASSMNIAGRPPSGRGGRRRGPSESGAWGWGAPRWRRPWTGTLETSVVLCLHWTLLCGLKLSQSSQRVCRPLYSIAKFTLKFVVSIFISCLPNVSRLQTYSDRYMTRYVKGFNARTRYVTSPTFVTVTRGPTSSYSVLHSVSKNIRIKNKVVVAITCIK